MKKVCVALVCAIIFLVIPYGSSVEAASKKVSLTISKGVTYYGEVLNGKPHGKGSMKWGENKTYSGDWVNGKRSGYGKFVVIDKSEAYLEESSGLWDNIRTTVYTGYWKNDQKNGNGILIDHVEALHSGNQYDSVENGIFKNNEFVSGTVLATSSNNYYTFSYITNNKIITANASRDELQNAYYYNLEDINYLQMDFLETVEIGATTSISFTEKDKNGNSNTIQYYYKQENEYGAFSILKLSYKNENLVSEVNSNAEVENGLFLLEVLNKLKPYNNEFNKIRDIYNKQFNS